MPSASAVLPFWDTFEVVFLACVGAFIGFVLGIFLPSAWRTFRRFWRRYRGYTQGSALHLENNSPHLLQASELESAFVKAKFLSQSHQERQAAAVYIAILTHQNTSKEQTLRALFELAQVYLALGLKDKAFEAGYELLKRRPRHSAVVEHILIPCATLPLRWPYVQKILHTHTTPLRLSVATQFAHALCEYIESNSRSKDLSFQPSAKAEGIRTERKVEPSLSFGYGKQPPPEGGGFLHTVNNQNLKIAKQAENIDPTCIRAKLYIWQHTSQELWSSPHMDNRLMWLTLIHDIEAAVQFLSLKNISPEPCMKHIYTSLKKVAYISQPTLNDIWPEIHQHLAPLYQNSKTTTALQSFFRYFHLWRTKGKQPLLHQCQKCGNIQKEFLWQCPQCLSYETYAIDPYCSSEPGQV